MSVKRTVTFSLPRNVDEFLTAYASLLKCESVEDFLREEIQQHFSLENIIEPLPKSEMEKAGRDVARGYMDQVQKQIRMSAQSLA